MRHSQGRPLRICIDARLVHGRSGGVEQVVLGLAAALSRLGDGDEEYLFLSLAGEDGWLAPSLTGPCRPLTTRPPAPSAISTLAAALPGLARLYGASLWRPRVPESDGTIESAGADLVHFTFQNGFRTRIPSIYHPHDLQHLHLPQFFTRAERRWRNVHYGELCRRSAMVAVASNWVKLDVVDKLGVGPEKVQIVPLAPIVGHYRLPASETALTLRARFALPERFAFYPAQTWPHKNHLRLLDAIAGLRERRGETLSIVCSGRLSEHARIIRAHARRLGLEGSLHLLGFVSPDELRALYAMARCVVIPTLFEAASFPLWEAFESGVPAACSNVTSLPEQAGDAAVVFDPRDPDAMAEAIWRVWTDEPLRERLISRGRERVRQFTWERTARTFRAHYRRICGRPLSVEDRALLDAPVGSANGAVQHAPLAANSDLPRSS